ncbi:hypothetical protein NGM37_56645, partial [Streptomyces sp. TRM76130]|nr:hypothetical protein [Streptomyces sp. TRM76130]
MPGLNHRLALRLRLFLTPGTGRHRRARHQPHPTSALSPSAAPACRPPASPATARPTASPPPRRHGVPPR